ncbi:MAG: HAMP domain-containing histidine kinase [Alphaproteobacteria bacterium]|nr:HAMP domain-containing histidine kinase [Alphaproteobacteria bacterium]
MVSTWVHRDIRDETEQALHCALMMRLMAIAALPVIVLPVALLSYFSPQQLIPAVLVVSALSLLLVGYLAQTGRWVQTAMAALFGAAAAMAALVSVTGGLTSPFLFWVLVLPVEAAWLARSRKALATGLLALVTSVGLVAVAQLMWPQSLAPTVDNHVFGAVASIAGLVLYAAMMGARLLKTPVQPENPAQQDDTGVRSMLNRLPGLVTFHDSKSGVCAVHGSDAKQLMNTVGELSGGGFAEHIHVSDRIEFLQAIDQLRTGQDTRSLIVRMRNRMSATAEDQFRHWSIQLVALRDRHNRYNGFIAQSRDITSEIELRRSYVRKVGEAEAANEAKTRFLAAVSHELRTPLNAILGFSDILTSGICGNPLDDKQSEYVGLIRQSGQHLLSVINSMLDLSKIDAGRYELNLEPFDIREAIQNCEAMLSQQARDNKIVLTTRVAKGHVQLTACRRAVQQVLINLMANAIKFTDENGVVTVDAMDHDGFTRITVSDTGIGMSQEDLQKIGSPFVQIQADHARQYEGTGLGLSLVKGLIDLHEGQFAVESSPGVGTTVTVDLPLGGPREAAEQGETHAASKMEFPPRLAPATQSDTEDVHDQAKTA